MMDLPFEFDPRPITRAVRTAEVISLFFPWLGKALILDTRHDATTLPAVFVDDLAASVDERLHRLIQRRPSLGRPARLAAVAWPAGLNSFVEIGVYDQLVRRCRLLGAQALEADCAQALTILRQAERHLKLAYVRGEHCRTLYQRGGQGGEGAKGSEGTRGER